MADCLPVGAGHECAAGVNISMQKFTFVALADRGLL
jgi:hypothetical protein